MRWILEIVVLMSEGYLTWVTVEVAPLAGVFFALETHSSVRCRRATFVGAEVGCVAIVTAAVHHVLVAFVTHLCLLALEADAVGFHCRLAKRAVPQGWGNGKVG